MLPFIILGSLWFISRARFILFWIYLWQLKEYHIGRFLDHFRTHKGKRLFFNWLIIFKIVLLLYALFLPLYFSGLLPWQIYAVWIFILAVLYLLESLKSVFALVKKRLKKPVLTQKTLILIPISLILEGLFAYLIFRKFNFYWFSFSLLSFDILTPLFVSGIVLFLQPITVLLRNRILKKAGEKIEKRKDLVVIGITGSYGKTSTKEFLAAILSQKYRVLKTNEHQNSEVGISRCILNDLKDEHQIFICEMGAYNRGGIKLLCSIAKPKIGILTGINEQHLATFLSRENIIKTKYELIESLPEDGLAIFNGDNTYCWELYQKTEKPKKVCGKPSLVKNPDVWAEEIKTDKEFISFKVFSKDGDNADFGVNLLGVQNVENILLAACCAKELGMNLKEIARECREIKPGPGTMKLIRSEKGINIIDSTYSANPEGVISHLDYLKIWSDRKIIVMPSLIELGSASKEIHRRIGEKIGEVCDLAIITTKDRFGEVKEGFEVRERMLLFRNLKNSEVNKEPEPKGRGRMLESGKPEPNILCLESKERILDQLKSFCQPGDVILFEGRSPGKIIELLTGNS